MIKRIILNPLGSNYEKMFWYIWAYPSNYIPSDFGSESLRCLMAGIYIHISDYLVFFRMPSLEKMWKWLRAPKKTPWAPFLIHVLWFRSQRRSLKSDHNYHRHRKMDQTCLFYFWFWKFNSFLSKIILNWLLTAFCALKAPLQFHFLVRSLLSPFQKSRYSEMIPQFPFLYSKLQALQLAGKGWLHLVKDEDGVGKSRNCHLIVYLYSFHMIYIFF